MHLNILLLFQAFLQGVQLHRQGIEFCQFFIPVVPTFPLIQLGVQFVVGPFEVLQIFYRSHFQTETVSIFS